MHTTLVFNPGLYYFIKSSQWEHRPVLACVSIGLCELAWMGNTAFNYEPVDSAVLARTCRARAHAQAHAITHTVRSRARRCTRCIPLCRRKAHGRRSQGSGSQGHRAQGRRVSGTQGAGPQGLRGTGRRVSTWYIVCVCVCVGRFAGGATRGTRRVSHGIEARSRTCVTSCLSSTRWGTRVCVKRVAVHKKYALCVQAAPRACV